MRLKKGVSIYRIPKIGTLMNVTVDEGIKGMKGYRYNLQIVEPSKIARFDSGELGRPTLVALMPSGMLCVWPLPDRDGMTIEIVYTPPPRRY